MAPSAPLCVPVEIAPASARDVATPRVFRLLAEIAVDRLVLHAGLPDEPEWLRGALQVGFHLPGPPSPVIECAARAEEIVVQRGEDGEHASLRVLRLVALPQEAATRIESYVDERLLSA